MDLDEMIQKKQETVNTMNYKGRDTMREGKLVRDNIPDIIRADGKTPVTRILDQEEYLNELDRKLQEEVAEYQADRKSTRLNSSHVSISYAVFCLKKKNRSS